MSGDAAQPAELESTPEAHGTMPIVVSISEADVLDQRSSGDTKVSVITISGDHLLENYPCQSSICVNELMQRVQAETGFPISCLLAGSQILEDSKALWECGVTEALRGGIVLTALAPAPHGVYQDEHVENDIHVERISRCKLIFEGPTFYFKSESSYENDVWRGGSLDQDNEDGSGLWRFEGRTGKIFDLLLCFETGSRRKSHNEWPDAVNKPELVSKKESSSSLVGVCEKVCWDITADTIQCRKAVLKADEEDANLESGDSPDDALRKFLLAASYGHDGVSLPAGYSKGEGVIGHAESGIMVLNPPLHIGDPNHDDVILLYHYAPLAAFSRITASADLRQLRASYAERAHFGDGVYTSQFAPHQFGSVDAVLLNNYTNKADPAQQEIQIAPWREKGVADYCIPLIVPRAASVNVREQKTKEMDKPGYTARHNEPLRDGRDVWVVVIPNEDGQAQHAEENLETIYIRVQDQDWSVRLHGIEVLAGIAATTHDQRATDAIVHCLRDDDFYVCIAAIWAVASSKALILPEALQLIQQVIDENRDPQVKDAAVDARQFLLDGMEHYSGPEGQ